MTEPKACDVPAPAELVAALTELAARMSSTDADPTAVLGEQVRLIDVAIDRFLADSDFASILWLRRLFNPLISRDTAIGIAQLQRLETAALQASEHVADNAQWGTLLEEHARNLHKKGYHVDAIKYFQAASQRYSEAGQDFLSLRAYFMTATCYRPLNDAQKAEQIIDDVLNRCPKDLPWRGEPIHAKALLRRDEGRLGEAEQLIREALEYYKAVPNYASDTHDNSDILISGALADLGEVKGLQGDQVQARKYMLQSLGILDKYGGQYKRHIARTRLKLAEVYVFEAEYVEALRMLHTASDELTIFDQAQSGATPYYDWLWRIELLQAFIYFRTGYLRTALCKLRLSLMYRRELGLPIGFLVRQLLRRLVATVGYVNKPRE